MIEVGKKVKSCFYEAEGVVVDVNPDKNPDVAVSYGHGRDFYLYKDELKEIGEYDSSIPNVIPLKCGRGMGALCCRFFVEDVGFNTHGCGRFTDERYQLGSQRDKRMPNGLYPDCLIEPIETYQSLFGLTYQELEDVDERIVQARAEKIEYLVQLKDRIEKIPEGSLVSVRPMERKVLKVSVKQPPGSVFNYEDKRLKPNEVYTGQFRIMRDVSNPDSQPRYEIVSESSYVSLEEIEPTTSKLPNFIIVNIEAPEK